MRSSSRGFFCSEPNELSLVKKNEDSERKDLKNVHAHVDWFSDEFQVSQDLLQ